jgi:hypothetical protein
MSIYDASSNKIKKVFLYDDYAQGTVNIKKIYVETSLVFSDVSSVVLYNGTFMEEIDTGTSFSTYPQIKVTVVGQPYGGDYLSYTHIFTSTGYYYHGLEPVLEAISYGGTIWLVNYGDNFSEGTIKVEGLS